MSSRRQDEKSRLRMDNYSSRRSWGRSRGSPPRRRELDNVIRKARKEGPDKSSYWNKKLLEVEERDPNRWRHSGFKELYGNSRSKSRSPSRSRSRSLIRPKSPPLRPPSPRKTKARAKSPRSPVSRPRQKSPQSSRSRHKSPSRSKSGGKSRRRLSPPPKARSESMSSGTASSCSDDSCSVCSPKTKKKPMPKEKEREHAKVADSPRGARRSRSRSFSVPRSKPSASDKSRRKTKRKREKEKIRDKQPRRKQHPTIKVESESDRSSSPSSPGPRLTLSERFGKMAQWSVNRDIDPQRNLKVISGDQLTVEMDRTPSPHYPGSLSSLPEGTSFDDVHVRYNYYKDRGYLGDLTLQDYIEWEEWWYKYQDWLKNGRSYKRYHSYRRR